MVQTLLRPPVTVRRVRPGRLEPAFADARSHRGPYLMLTVEPTAVELDRAGALLDRFDAVLGPTDGDGWWAYGLREPAYAAMMPDDVTDAGVLALATLRLGLRIAMLPVRAAADAWSPAAGHR